ncbi:MAG: hypothetical protein ACFHHU_13740 [Porticoccaceae bacterium]
MNTVMQRVNHPEGSAKMLVVGLSLHALMDGFAIRRGLCTGRAGFVVATGAGDSDAQIPRSFQFAQAYSLMSVTIKRSMTDLLLFAAATPLAILLSATMFAAVDQSYIGLIYCLRAGTFYLCGYRGRTVLIFIYRKSRKPFGWYWAVLPQW